VYNAVLIIPFREKWKEQRQQIMQVNHLHQSLRSDISHRLIYELYKLISAWTTTSRMAGRIQKIIFHSSREISTMTDHGINSQNYKLNDISQA
jgi:hypothetical protein